MAADPHVSLHRSFWRRLRRRYWPSPGWVAMLAPVAFALRYSVLAWFGRDSDWGWATEAVRCGWFGGAALLLFAKYSTPHTRRRWSRLVAERPRSEFAEHAVIPALVLAALWRGRLDLAVLAGYGLGAVLEGWRRIRWRQWDYLVSLLLKATAALSFYVGDPLLFALCLPAADLIRVSIRPGLTAVAKEKPSRDTYLRDARARYRGFTGLPVEESVARSLLLRALREAEAWDEALQVLDDRPPDPFARPDRHVERAWLLVCGGRAADVTRLWAGYSSPGNLGSPLAVAHARLGNHEEGLRIGRAALARRAAYVEGALAEVYRESGDAQAALDWYERAAWRYGPQSARVMRATGEMLLALGDDQEASVAFERAVRQSPYLRPEDLRLLGACCRRMGKEHAADEIEQLAWDRERSTGAGEPP